MLLRNVFVEFDTITDNVIQIIKRGNSAAAWKYNTRRNVSTGFSDVSMRRVAVVYLNWEL